AGRGVHLRPVRRRTGGLRRRYGLRSRRAVPDARHVRRRGADGQRLHGDGRVLPVHPGARERSPHGARLPVAVGHRLVLVLGCVRAAGAVDTPAVAAPVPTLGRVPAPGRPRPPVPAQCVGGAPARPPRGGGDPGRRGTRGTDARVPRPLPPRDRHHARVAVSGAAAVVRGLAAVPAGAGRAVRQRGVLVECAAAVVIDVRSPHALSYLATAPGDLGLARAYVTGAVEVDGDLYTALALVAGLDLDLPLRARLRLLRDLGGVRLLRRPPRPEQEVRLRGRRHSKARDQRAIAHHYDVSNRFYNW